MQDKPFSHYTGLNLQFPVLLFQAHLFSPTVAQPAYITANHIQSVLGHATTNRAAGLLPGVVFCPTNCNSYGFSANALKLDSCEVTGRGHGLSHATVAASN